MSRCLPDSVVDESLASIIEERYSYRVPEDEISRSANEPRMLDQIRIGLEPVRCTPRKSDLLSAP